MALLYGRTECLTAQNGGCLPGQMLADIFPTMGIEVRLGFGRIVALHHRSPPLYQIR
jgi:hypothetical protein